MRWLWTLVVILGLGLGGPSRAAAFTMGEALGTAAIQGTLAGQSSSGVAGTVSRVRSSVNQSVSARNNALSAALGGGAPPTGRAVGGGGTNWMSNASAQAPVVSKSWSSLQNGPGSTAGWRNAESFQGTGASQAWTAAGDAWVTGGLIP